MGKRYHCDYCNRSFKDAPEARKKHLISLQHIKNRDEHYRYFKDPEEIYKEESKKNPCMRFFQNGECQFGITCRYSHYTPEQMNQLNAIVISRAQVKKTKTFEYPDTKEIIKEFFEDIIDPEEIHEKETIWPRTPELEDRLDLPPSLWPITCKNFPSCEFPQWGWR